MHRLLSGVYVCLATVRCYKAVFVVHGSLVSYSGFVTGVQTLLELLTSYINSLWCCLFTKKL